MFRLTSEGSTPFINLRWVLLTLKQKDSKLYMLNGVAIFLIFFLVRIITIVPNWLIFFSLINTPQWFSIDFKYKLICVGACIPLDCLNLFWYSKIIKLVYKTFFAQKKSNERTTCRQEIVSQSETKKLMEHDD